MARPSVMTDEVIRKIEEVAALDGSVGEMAFWADIHPDTIYAHLKEDKEFSDRINALRERPILKARQTITKALDDPHHAFKYLEKKRRKEFGNAIDVTSDGEKLANVDTDKVIKELTTKLNDLHRNTESSWVGDSKISSTL